MAMTACNICGFLFDEQAEYCPACAYKQATLLKTRAVSFGDYETAGKLFLRAGNYQDAQNQAALCEEAAEECRREAIYQQAVKRQGTDQSSWQGKADLMRSITGFRDADALGAEYQQKADALAAEAETLRQAKEAAQQEEAQNQLQEHKRRRRWLFLLAGTMVLCVGIVLTVSLAIIPTLQYRKAKSLFDAGNYTAACTAFSEILPYRESEQYLAESYWHLGLQAEIDQNDIAAAENFAKAGNIQDAPARLLATQERLYNTALAALQNKQFDKAQDLFQAADDYNDAKAYKHFCRALRVWNGESEESKKVNLEKAADILWKTMDGVWYCEESGQKITVSDSTRQSSTPDLVIQDNTLRLESGGVSYTVEIYSLNEIRLIAGGPLAGAYEKQ